MDGYFAGDLRPHKSKKELKREKNKTRRQDLVRQVAREVVRLLKEEGYVRKK